MSVISIGKKKYYNRAEWDYLKKMNCQAKKEYELKKATAEDSDLSLAAEKGLFKEEIDEPKIFDDFSIVPKNFTTTSANDIMIALGQHCFTDLFFFPHFKDRRKEGKDDNIFNWFKEEQSTNKEGE